MTNLATAPLNQAVVLVEQAKEQDLLAARAVSEHTPGHPAAALKAETSAALPTHSIFSKPFLAASHLLADKPVFPTML